MIFILIAFLVKRDRKVAERFNQPRLGRNESERWGKWAGIRKNTTTTT